MAVTIKDIAKKANVSISTVSRVINNKKEGIGEETRKRVLKIIEELDYYPNNIARSMITKQSKTIGLIIPDIQNPFFPDLVRGVEDAANQFHYSMILYNSDGKLEKETESLRFMREKSVDGIIFTSSYASANHPFQEIIDKHRIPIVLLDRGLEDAHSSGVYINNEKAGFIGTQHLINLSHVKIGCITGPKHIQNSIERLNGYIRAHKEAGLPVNEDLIISGDYKMEGGDRATKQLLKKEEVTSIFALNDLMAFGVYKAISELGLRIPEDISVVGLDNIKYNELLVPKLTTLDQSAYKMGGAAAKMIINQIERKQYRTNETVYFEPELIIRESCMKRTPPT